MPAPNQGARQLLRRLREIIESEADGQQRLNRLAQQTAFNLVADVCSIYLTVEPDWFELFATHGLSPDSVHRVRLRRGQGLVGRIADTGEIINTNNAREEPGFVYLPETGEDAVTSFLGVPIRRLGRMLGVLVLQNQAPRIYDEDEIEALSIVATVLAETADSGRLAEDLARRRLAARGPWAFAGTPVQEGVALGQVVLHQPWVRVEHPIADNPEVERERLQRAMQALRGEVDQQLAEALAGGEHRDVLEAYRMFAHDRGWMRRMEAHVAAGLVAEAAVEQAQLETRDRMLRLPDPYLRERIHDLDDLANRLLRKLSGAPSGANVALPEDAVLVARNIGPGELLEYGRGQLKGLILQEGSTSGHAAVVARALNLPMIVRAEGILERAESGDPIAMDGTLGRGHLRPPADALASYIDKQQLARQAEEEYRNLRDLPATTRDGVTVRLDMNAGLLADLPSLLGSGAEGVGLYRTELQFLVRTSMPKRAAQASLYSRVLDSAHGKRVVFRTLDIGSDKVLPYMKRAVEENPAIGWRAVRVGLDRPRLFRMQMQALIRGAAGRPLSVMFPMITDAAEFSACKALLLAEVEHMAALGYARPAGLEIGAMLETPALLFAPDSFYQQADFISVGGNDLHQFLFAADRGNDRVANRYDSLHPAFLRALQGVVTRCAASGTPLSFCGEIAGRPLEAVVLAALGFRALSMRPAAIGPVKKALRAADLGLVRRVIDDCLVSTDANPRAAVARVMGI